MKFKEIEIPSLDEYIKDATQKFKDEIKMPIFATMQEKMISESIVKFNEKTPGYFDYLIDIVTSSHRHTFKDLFGQSPLTYQSNPRIFKIVEAAASNLNMTLPNIYLLNERNASILGYSNNAFCSGKNNRYVIFISPEIADENNFTDQELSFTVGHEMGHAMCNHIIYGSFMEMSKKNEDAITAQDKLEIMRLNIDDSFSRYCEFSADRAGLIASGDIGASIEQFKKEIKRRPDIACYDHSKLTHPNHDARIKALELFSKSELYYKIIDKRSTSFNLLSDAELQKEIDKLVK